MKNRPSSHFLLLILLFALDALAYFIIYRAGVERGYSPSLLLALRDLALFFPIFAIVVWIARRHRYAGDLTLFTVAILLFTVGRFMHYPLFTDPEYTADRRSEAREPGLAKANTLRQRYVNQYYDADKKRALFGDPEYNIPIKESNANAGEESYWTLKRILSSVSTLIPILAMLGFCVAFIFTKRDDVLLWLQR